MSDSREKEGRRDLRAAAESVAQDGHAAFCAPAEAGEWALLLGLAINVLGNAIHALAEAAQEQVAYWNARRVRAMTKTKEEPCQRSSRGEHTKNTHQ